jgi:hypothetical protein
MADNVVTEWDDDCPGLVETLAREVEWKDREAHNEAVQWGVSSTDGWGATPSASPVEEAWPGMVADEHSGNWPSVLEVVPTRADGWPDLSCNVEGGVEVTVEVVTDVGKIQGEHSTCRF